MKTSRASEPSDGVERQDLREVRNEKAPCDGCVRGLRTFRRGPNSDTTRWHWDGAHEWACTGTFDNWDTRAEAADFCSREMHTNTIKGVEGCFTQEEWNAASQEMHDSGNSSWCGVVAIAIRKLREKDSKCL